MSATAQTTSALRPEASRLLGERAGDPDGVAQLRANAAEAAGRMEWPDSYAQRPWKYLNVSNFDIAPFVPGMDAVTRQADGRRSCPVTGEHATVVVTENSEATFREEAPEGLSVVPFEDAYAKQRALIQQYLGSSVAYDQDRFTAYHYAFLRGGLLIEVSPNVEIDLPVRLVRQAVSANQLVAPHTLIVTGAHSRVNVIEEFSSGEGDVLALPVIEAIPGPGAMLRYTAIHRWGERTRVVMSQNVTTERDSSFVGMNLVTGGRVVKGNLASRLVGRGSSSELYGLVMGSGAQHVDFTTLQDHIGPDTRSDLLFKSALKDTSRSVYYGVTRVGLGGRNADANQENRNLLLSKEARADSDPVLEILTSDIIRCSHGATAGPVDDEQLYYLQTRGIPHAAAEALLVRAYLGQVLDRVPDAALRDELADVLERKLG